MELKTRVIGQLLFTLLAILMVAGSCSGGWSDPYFVAGQVTLDGEEVSGATIVIENLETEETNTHDSDGDEKDDPTIVTTNSNGTYIFQLLDYEDGFDDGDQIKVTATKGDDTGSVTITVDVDGGAGTRDADIELAEEEEDAAAVPALDDATICVFFGGMMIIVVVSLLWRGRRRAGTRQI